NIFVFEIKMIIHLNLLTQIKLGYLTKRIMTEQIQINRQTIYLTIENVKLETKNGIEEQENQFVGFFKLEPVTEISLGEQIKNPNGENLVFNSREQARNEISDILKRRIYPPSFLNPMDYTTNNLMEIMHKQLTFD